jgi:hypothetical protein
MSSISNENTLIKLLVENIVTIDDEQVAAEAMSWLTAGHILQRYH